jgi:hypothetical protein
VILSMRYTINKGYELGIEYKKGIGPFHLRLADAHHRKNTFYEVEKIYRLNLAEEDGARAFNLFFSEFMPQVKNWDDLPTVVDGAGVQTLRTNWRGKGTNIHSDGSVELAVYSRRFKSDYSDYPMCFAEVQNKTVQPEKCNYSAFSSKESHYANRIKWISDNEANYIGLVGLSNPDVETQKDGAERTTNLHFSIQYNDRSAEDYNALGEKAKKLVGFQDYYDKLSNIRTALAMDAMPELYGKPGFWDIGARVRQLQDKYRNVEHTLQNMDLEIYMDEAFTKTILTRTPEEVKAIIAKFDISQSVKNQLLKSFQDAQAKTGDQQVKTLVKLYNNKDRKPYFAGLIMALGKDHVSNVEAGHLAIRFRSEAADLGDNQKFKELIVGPGLHALEKRIFIAKDEFSDPDAGVARLSSIKLYTDPNNIGPGRPRKLYLDFISNLKSTFDGRPLQLVGHFSEFRLFRADKRLSDVKVDNVHPYETVDGQFRYVIELDEATAAGLGPGGDYTLQFDLVDPALSDELPSKRLTETREAAFNI